MRLKDGMDTAEPSSNGVSTRNLMRLACLLDDDNYDKVARGTLAAFEVEIMQYPWLFASFMPAVVSANIGVTGVIRVGDEGSVEPAGAAAKEEAPQRKKSPTTITEGSLAVDPRVNGRFAKSPSGAGEKSVIGGEMTEADVRNDEKLGAGEAVVEPGRRRWMQEGGGEQKAKDLESGRGSLSGLPKPRPKARGAVKTTSYVDNTHGHWLRGRNKLLTDLKPKKKGQVRYMMCEGNTCREIEKTED